jgi:hypothetical protein
MNGPLLISNRPAVADRGQAVRATWNVGPHCHAKGWEGQALAHSRSLSLSPISLSLSHNAKRIGALRCHRQAFTGLIRGSRLSSKRQQRSDDKLLACHARPVRKQLAPQPQRKIHRHLGRPQDGVHRKLLCHLRAAHNQVRPRKGLSGFRRFSS